MKIKIKKLSLPAVLLLIALLLLSWYLQKNQPVSPAQRLSLEQVPAFSGEPFVVLEDNQPLFSEKDLTTKSYEYYSPLDDLGRCGYAMACVGYDLMPTEDRESISSVKPSGWVQNKYDFVDGKSLYNRCHLIGFQLTGENANERNLITGTRYLNVEGMLPFENMIADFVKETRDHVLYRVTPIYDGNDLVAKGVVMEAYSVEDAGESICFNVYVYNNQPGVTIDYVTGDNWQEAQVLQPDCAGDAPVSQVEYILNTNSKKFHSADCAQGQNTKKENKANYFGSREELIAEGYISAGCCKP